MQITTTITEQSRLIALDRALAAYNARNTPLTEEAFLQKLVEGQLDGLVSSYLTTVISKLDFLSRFTDAERVNILTVAQSNMTVADYLNTLNAATEVNLTSARTIAGVQGLEAAGLIEAGRAAAILTV